MKEVGVNKSCIQCWLLTGYHILDIVFNQLKSV